MTSRSPWMTTVRHHGPGWVSPGSIQGAMVSGRRAAEGWIARVGADAAV